jgi:signal transduction histidine kinase/CheY-like chemotaxis protein
MKQTPQLHRSERSRTDSPVGVFRGGGEMGERISSFNWSETALGPIATWPQSLKTAVQIMLTSRQPIWLGWGPELTKLYNDPYQAIVGGKHPTALGQPAAVVWREIWEQIGPMLTTTMGVEGTYVEEQLLIMERNGYPEETYYTFSYSPVPNDNGEVGGIICANTDDTQRVIGERQLALLRELAASTADARTTSDTCARSTASLATNPHDLPFALVYLLDQASNQLVLAGTSGAATPGQQIAPHRMALDSTAVCPCAEAFASGSVRVIEELAELAALLPRGAWDRPPQRVAVLPIAAQGSTGMAGVLVVGLSPYRLFDDRYRGFLELVAAQVSAGIANAQAYEEERRRAEALAELDRAKTTFFANISHEFRTPLTLMLGPLGDLLQHADAEHLEPLRAPLEIAHRNALRLLKLVNTLLDFARIEAGRIAATFAPTDLATLTAELASVFRSTVEHAGLDFTVSCAPLDEPVYVDREMWETIVFNLLSNAFKFTFVGEIGVHLRRVGAAAELTVRDTGIGISAAEQPRLFERFHRVSGARGRTFEGRGIGLARVQELVRLHGGSVRVESAVDRGSAFVITIPLGTAHLPQDRIGAAPATPASAVRGSAYADEARRWLPDEPAAPLAAALALEPAPAEGPGRGPARPHILLADDNADIRAYVRRLLSPAYHVETAADGAAALRAARTTTQDLVLADVMMPELDGFGLLRELRADPKLRTVPIMLLSARAGEEARVEGLEAGADDYLIKPFSARELLARITARLELSRLRAQLDQDRAALANLFNQSPVPVAVLRGPNLVYDLANPAYHALTGGRELVGRPLLEALPELSGQGFAELVRRVMQTGRPIVVHEALVILDRAQQRGREDTYWTFIYAPLYNTDGQIDSVVAICNGVTEQVRARQKLERLAEASTIPLRSSACASSWWTTSRRSLTCLRRFLYPAAASCAQHQTPARRLSSWAPGGRTCW